MVLLASPYQMCGPRCGLRIREPEEPVALGSIESRLENLKRCAL